MISRILNNSLPNDVKVLTKNQFIEFEKNYWKNSTALGFNPSDSLLLDEGFSKKAYKLRNPSRVLFDKLSSPEFGPIEE